MANEHIKDKQGDFICDFIYGRILTAVWDGKSPYSIGDNLEWSDQRLYPYVQELKHKGAIVKKGYIWQLTSLGKYTVKNMLTRGVNLGGKHEIFFKRVHHTCIEVGNKTTT